MHELIFKMVIKQDIQINLSLEEIRRFPLYNSSYSRFEEKMIIIEFNPVKGFDVDSFSKMMKNKIKKQYRAYTLELISRSIKELN